MPKEIDELTELELVKDLKKALRQEGDINIDRLEFIYEGDELVISGAVNSEEDLDNLKQILADYFGENEGYHIEANVVDPDDVEYLTKKKAWEEDEYKEDEEEELEEIEEGSEDDYFEDDDEY